MTSLYTEKQTSWIPLSAVERHQILYKWNDTYAAYPSDKCIHELFEKQVERTPNALAVTVYNSDHSIPQVERALTYQELNSRANQLAHYLQSLGVGPEVLVGICAERSLQMIIGILGILKAGGAYVPMDPNYPKHRLSFMLNDARVSILLTQKHLHDKLPSHVAKTVYLDNDWEDIKQHSNKNAYREVKPENLAYVIYTSGSTGVPKGTLIIHRGVVNYLSWCVKAYNVADGQGAPVNSSIAFDATITSFFSPLIAGRQVVLLPEQGEIEALSSVLQSGRQFSLVKITPAHLDILNHLLPKNNIENQTNAFVIGGEALTSRSLSIWRSKAPATRLINEYGPTETVVGCCVYEVQPQDACLEAVPIGRPIANTQIYILDEELQPVPVGVAGEIYIGGAGVARGYLNRPELTAERFIQNPFNTNPNERIYKTGDLARYLEDGNIVYLGRIDQQVKIRGYRIELGEIEVALSQHPLIQQVVVIAREDIPGEKRLAAYLVLNSDVKPSVADIRQYLKERLPEYMVPAAFVFLKELPLTHNGKIDRSALPVPVLLRAESEKQYVAPRNATERKLIKMCEESLNIRSIGIKDDFFQLGGNSIQAARFFSKIRKTFGKQLPLAILFEATTIEQLAKILGEKESRMPWSSLIPIQPNGTKPPLFCVHGGAGTVLFYRNLASCLGQDQPFYGLQAKGLNGTEPPHMRIEDMATYYVREIRSVQPQGPYHLAGYCFGGIVAFEMAQQLIRQGCEVAFLATLNGVSPTYVYHQQTVEENEPVNKETIETLGEKMSIRLQRFASLSTKEKFLFPLKKLKRKLWNERVKMLVRQLAYRFYLSIKVPLPESLGKKYFLEMNGKMATDYRPQPYPGRLIVFRSPLVFHDPSLGWSNYVKGGIETCDIPGEHWNRWQILHEPYVHFLAENLSNYLNKTAEPEKEKV